MSYIANWIPVEWRRQEDVQKHRNGIAIRGQHSPFYEGVRYAVRQGTDCLSISGEWEFEPATSRRDDGFYEKFRFKSFEEAVEAAESICGNLRERK